MTWFRIQSALAPGTFLSAIATGVFAQAPSDYGPVSADVSEIPYPYAVSTLSFVLYGKDVRMAYMDVRPTGPPRGLEAAQGACLPERPV